MVMVVTKMEGGDEYSTLSVGIESACGACVCACVRVCVRVCMYACRLCVCVYVRESG